MGSFSKLGSPFWGDPLYTAAVLFLGTQKGTPSLRTTHLWQISPPGALRRALLEEEEVIQARDEGLPLLGAQWHNLLGSFEGI